jgi:hypothetical protein
MATIHVYAEHGSFVSPFAMQLQNRTDAEMYMTTLEQGYFGNPCAAVVESQQEGMIPPALPVGAARKT